MITIPDWMVRLSRQAILPLVCVLIASCVLGVKIVAVASERNELQAELARQADTQPAEQVYQPSESATLATVREAMHVAARRREAQE